MSLRIYKNNTNDLFMTLRELTTIEFPQYIMELKSKNSNTSKTFRLGIDISLNPTRWNVFSVTETEAEDLENAQIELQRGQYDYIVYETTGSTGNTIEGLKWVEKGLLTVIDEEEESVSAITNSDFTITLV